MTGSSRDPQASGLPAQLSDLAGALDAGPGDGLFTGRRAATGTTKRAAVLALFFVDPDAAESGPAAGLRTVIIEKTPHLRKHAGQLAFPGGRIEAGETPVQAALREAAEEVGVEADGVQVLGELPAANVHSSGFDVHTIVGWWREPRPLAPVDLGEVAAVHVLRVPDLVAAANRATWVHPGGFTGPVFLDGELFVWGLTGHLLNAIVDLAGWAGPWDAGRRLPIPERFSRGRS